MTAATQFLLWRDQRRTAGVTTDAATESGYNETVSSEVSAKKTIVDEDKEIKI